MKINTQNKRLVCIGDIHGCYNELQELLSLFTTSDTNFLFLGDLVDRGPDSQKVVEFVARMVRNGTAWCVMGNHDESHVRWHRYKQVQKTQPKFQIPMRFNDHKIAVYESFGPRDIEFLCSLPVYVEFEHAQKEWVGVHAGLEPYIPLEKQDPRKMTHIRYVKQQTGKSVPIGENFEAPPGSIYWTDAYQGTKSVVYGHMVHSLRTPKVSQLLTGATTIGLDTGAVFGGKLSAAVFDPEIQIPMFVSVSAKAKYWSMSSWKET